MVKEKSADPRTLEFAYSEGQKILSNQVYAADTLDTKVVAVFSVATVLIGVMPPLINSWVHVQGMSILKDWLSLSLLIIAGICYIVIFRFSLRSIWTRRFGIIPSMNYVYKRLDLSPSDIRKAIVKKHMMVAYKTNKISIRKKATKLKIVIITVGVEVLFLLLLFIRVSFLTEITSPS